MTIIHINKIIKFANRNQTLDKISINILSNIDSWYWNQGLLETVKVPMHHNASSGEHSPVGHGLWFKDNKIDVWSDCRNKYVGNP